MLRDMWERGLSASQIAYELGDVSRNAVIGKAHRTGCVARPSPIGWEGPQPWQKAGRTAFPKGEKPAHFVRHERVKKGILDVPPSPFPTCQWPQVAPSDPKQCTAKPVPGKPYCQEHCERAYRLKSAA